MSTITTLKLWRNPGYTEGCLEVPSLTASLPSPDVMTTQLNPAKGKLFSEVKLPFPYEDIYDMCYLEATFDMNNGNDVTFYGWIDNVLCLSDTPEKPISVIQWHVDNWRTFASKAVYGSGMVRRRPVSGDMPPQDYPYRYRTAETRYLISSYNNTNVWWCFVRRNLTTSGVTTSTWMVWPVSINSTSTNLKIEAGGYACPSLDELSSGSWDEKLSINPEEVSFIGVSPIPPCDYSGNGATSNIILHPSSSADWSYHAIGQRNCWTVTSADAMEELTIGFPLSRSMTTTDTVQYKVAGFDGEPIGTLPWGITFTHIRARNVLSSNFLSVQLRFIPSGMDDDDVYSNVMGGVFSACCPTLELGSNSWSSYVYSGARQAEISQRALDTDAEAIKGRISTASNTVSGFTSGAAMGALGGPLGILGGGLIGGLGSAVSGTMNTEMLYNYNKKYNDKIQNINDYATSNQASVQLVSGSGTDFCVSPYKGMTLIKMVNDTYSMQQRENDLQIYGCTVSEPRPSCQSLVEAGGPLQIDNLVVTGDIPSNAKTYLRERFSQGVRII